MTLAERMVLAVERVRSRLLRAAQALEAAGVPYAVAGDNAVAARANVPDDVVRFIDTGSDQARHRVVLEAQASRFMGPDGLAGVS